jgi:predicted DCC family thiol-disulfide oxidoreductase YuxK
MGTTGRHLVLYDGVCGLCNGLCQFVLPRDPRGVFGFAPLQGRTARELLSKFHQDPDQLDTFFVVANYQGHDERLYSKSAAASFLLQSLRRWWLLGQFLRVLPRTILDRAYDFVARHRYAWFGRVDHCTLPSTADRSRFIEDAP